MQLIKILLGLLTVFLITGCSSKQQTNDLPNEQYKKISKDLRGEHEYEKLKNKIISEHKDEWIKKGYEKAKEIVKLHKSDLIAFELGKYARKKGYVTEPEIIVIDNGFGGVEVHNLGCKIQKPLSVDEIFKIYGNKFLQKKELLNPVTKKRVYGNEASNEAMEDFIVQDVQEAYAQVERTFKKTYKNKTILDDYQVEYRLKDNEYLAIFNSKNELDIFCNQTSICGK